MKKSFQGRRNLRIIYLINWKEMPKSKNEKNVKVYKFIIKDVNQFLSKILSVCIPGFVLPKNLDFWYIIKDYDINKIYNLF